MTMFWEFESCVLYLDMYCIESLRYLARVRPLPIDMMLDVINISLMLFESDAVNIKPE